jgi:hypothetical protein
VLGDQPLFGGGPVYPIVVLFKFEKKVNELIKELSVLCWCFAGFFNENRPSIL